jgi:poly(A) polymerase
MGMPLYVVGGTVRNLLLGIPPADLDLAASGSARLWAESLRAELRRGTIVDLSGPEDEGARLVFDGYQIDISSFRGGAKTIEEDLALRDFTIGALALPLDCLFMPDTFLRNQVIDPTGGLADLDRGRVVVLPKAFQSDFLRMLRAYRLAAQLEFTIDEATREEVRRHARRIEDVARERVDHEMQQLFAARQTAKIVALMAEDGLLAALLPELWVSKEVVQPEFHHLDVFEHSLLALEKMELILEFPGRYYPQQEAYLIEYLQEQERRRWLKWSALLHDVGKPSTRQLDDRKGRITFHRHDQEGRKLVLEMAKRSRWSKLQAEKVASLVALHMHPFHLCNVRRENRLSRRAALKLCNRADEDLAGVFLLAMADSLACEGAKKPIAMEAELADLFAQVRQIYEEYIAPVQQGPPLLNGRDLLVELELAPGPTIGYLLAEIEAARVEGKVQNRDDALALAASLLQKSGSVDHRRGGA